VRRYPDIKLGEPRSPDVERLMDVVVPWLRERLP